MSVKLSDRDNNEGGKFEILRSVHKGEGRKRDGKGRKEERKKGMCSSKNDRNDVWHSYDSGSY